MFASGGSKRLLVVCTVVLWSGVVWGEAPWQRWFAADGLDGFRIVSGSATYRVEYGVLVGTTAEGSPNTFLVTKDPVRDFELEFEVKFDAALNSGVQIRSQTAELKPGATEKFGRVNGPQVEIEAGGAKGSVAGYVYGEATGRGWLTADAKRVPHQNLKKDDWNQYRIVARGARIQTWINGQPVDDLTDEPIFKTHPKGFIGLQVHGIKKGTGPFGVAWRNIRIRELK